MTLATSFMYIFFTAMVAAPIVEIASIGTQITEAFAGLDRIREVKRLATEDEHDAERDPTGRIKGDIEFEDVSFEYKADAPVLKTCFFLKQAAGSTTLWWVPAVFRERAR